jgi:Domain of unknown function (DUF4062)/TIR domain
MKFENDIFISYAHNDNKLYNTKDEEGWIDEFHRCLVTRVTEVFGKKPVIWRDRKLSGNDYFDKTIEDEISKSAILISVFSPPYLNSEWCIRELKKFCSGSEDISIGNKSRLFKIIKYPVEKNAFPTEVQRFLGYPFHTKTPPTPVLELRYSINEYQKEYYTVLSDLAEDIRDVLKILRTDDDLTSLPTQTTGSTIYLARTTSDLKDERDKIRRELQQFGHTVLPDEELPDYSPDFEKAVQRNLEQAQLSVHLMGERYGTIPEGAELSMTALQYRLAFAYKQNQSKFESLIWLPVGLQSDDSRQNDLISIMQNETECLQTSLEELKTIIQDKLKPKPNNLDFNLSNSLLYVYLIHDQKDSEDIALLYNYLMELPQFEVMLPDFSLDDVEFRQTHQENLKNCNAAILYYGKSNLAWLQRKLSDLTKAIGYGREKPILAQAVYVAEPKTPQKELFKTKQAEVIQDFDEFSPELLTSFLQQIEQRKGAIE